MLLFWFQADRFWCFLWWCGSKKCKHKHKFIFILYSWIETTARISDQHLLKLEDQMFKQLLYKFSIRGSVIPTDSWNFFRYIMSKLCFPLFFNLTHLYEKLFLSNDLTNSETWNPWNSCSIVSFHSQRISDQQILKSEDHGSNQFSIQGSVISIDWLARITVSIVKLPSSVVYTSKQPIFLFFNLTHYVMLW
jgi:hypothetical protein